MPAAEGKLPFPPNYCRVFFFLKKGSCQGYSCRYVLVKAGTKQHVTGSPSPYSCDLSPTLQRERRTGWLKRWTQSRERNAPINKRPLREEKKKKFGYDLIKVKEMQTTSNTSNRSDTCVNPFRHQLNPSCPLLLPPLPTSARQRDRKIAQRSETQRNIKYWRHRKEKV